MTTGRQGPEKLSPGAQISHEWQVIRDGIVNMLPPLEATRARTRDILRREIRQTPPASPKEIFTLAKDTKGEMRSRGERATSVEFSDQWIGFNRDTFEEYRGPFGALQTTLEFITGEDMETGKKLSSAQHSLRSKQMYSESGLHVLSSYLNADDSIPQARELIRQAMQLLFIHLEEKDGEQGHMNSDIILSALLPANYIGRIRTHLESTYVDLHSSELDLSMYQKHMQSDEFDETKRYARQFFGTSEFFAEDLQHGKLQEMHSKMDFFNDFLTGLSAKIG